MAAENYYHNSPYASAPPQGYVPPEPAAYETPARSHQMAPSRGVHYPSQYPPYQPSYGHHSHRQQLHPTHYVPLPQPVLQPVSNSRHSRSPPSPSPPPSSSKRETDPNRHDTVSSAAASKQKANRGIGGSLIGAASGALLGGQLGRREGHHDFGALGGAIAGAFGGYQAEGKWEYHRRKKQEEIQGDRKRRHARRHSHDGLDSYPNSGRSSDDDDTRHHRAALDAPEYGSGDAGHGGSRYRRRRRRDGRRGRRDSDVESI